MERRRVKRIKRRLPCEFLHDGNLHRGIVVDLSARGLFLQTEAALDPGARVEVRLSGRRFSGISLLGVVARRRFTPALLSSLIRRGVGLRILGAPEAYYEALHQLEHGVEGPGAASSRAACGGIPARDGAAPATDASATCGQTGPAQTADATHAPPAQPVVAEEPQAPLEDADGWVFAPESPAQALVVDDGELDDVHALLVELGAQPLLARGTDAAAFRGWLAPPRVLVASARSALRLRMPPQAVEDGVVTIAVAEADSRSLCSLLRRQGFEYVVRRPVHPEALRLLLMRALHRDSERRSVDRLAFGYEISWRQGWSRRRGLLTEISSEGCQVLSSEAPEPGCRLRVGIPREVADGRPFSLAGRVVRCERRLGSHAALRHAFSLRFAPLSQRDEERLASILEQRRLGPATLPGRVQPEARLAGPRPVPPAAEASPRGAEEGGIAATPERRRSPRGAMAREVVALDAAQQRAKQVLFGRDLSLGGIRVDPHPELALGDRTRLAIYDGAHVEALVLDATVRRDDGERGLVLHFEGVGGESRERLARMLSELPSLDHQGPEGPPAKPLVVAEILPA